MNPCFFIKSEGQFVKIHFADILLVEGCRNYVRIVTEKKSYLSLVTMKKMEHVLPVGLFRRIHKSFIISLSRVTGFDKDRVYLGDRELPFGQLYKADFIKSQVIVGSHDQDFSLSTPEENKQGFNLFDTRYGLTAK